MSIKIYQKRGPKNYKEKRIIDELQPIIDAKIRNNPDLADNWRPATTFEELKSLQKMYASENVEYTEVNEKNNIEEMDKDKNEEVVEAFDDFDDTSDFVDPFNRESPIVRDYVTEGGISEDSGKEARPTKTQFDEPVSWEDAFELPSDDSDEEPKKNRQEKQSEAKKEKTRPQPSEPINPHFDDMSSGKKKRSTKKFAKYIVETVCMLAEKGFVWYATKEINEAKLTEYELNGEMDLSLLINLEDGQEATVRQFFSNQCFAAEQISKIDAEEKADLAEALAEVLLEKGIGPTPMQELLLISAKVFGEKAIMLLSLKSQTNSLLSQLRAMNEANPAPRRYASEREVPTPTAPYTQTDYEAMEQQSVAEDEVESSQMVEEYFEQDPTASLIEAAEEIVVDNELEIGGVIETKE